VTIRCIYQTSPPDFPATDQHPDAVRYGPLTPSKGGIVYVDAIGGQPTVAELDAILSPKNVIAFGVFIARWTDAEYASLLQKRATAIGAGNVTLAKQWDIAASLGSVDLNTTASQNFKAAMVSNAILTQARADVIFS
jgi:hypothetical protein